ncbi:hypothetical protein [Streptomyces sp. NPDC047928]|uniref:hypothetical protein n=1 Tax=unclassified Streptomyces TaxID=2593676 RepID=UPI003721B0F0
MNSGGGHEESGLTKSVWSDADFEAMGWHDATVHGLYVQETDADLPRLLLDLNYIVRWVHPVRPAKHFSFWISPATLVQVAATRPMAGLLRPRPMRAPVPAGTGSRQGSAAVPARRRSCGAGVNTYAPWASGGELACGGAG